MTKQQQRKQTAREERERRLAEELRENLKKRKAQTRVRQKGAAEPKAGER